MTAKLKGRPRKAPITLADLPSRTGLSTQERIRISRLSLALHSDLRAPQKPAGARERNWGVGDATKERLSHARASGVRLAREEETFDDGRPTGLMRKRFIGRLEQLRDRGAITTAGYAAGQKFQRDVLKAASKASAGSARYEPRHIDCAPAPELHRIEIACDYKRSVHAAYRAIKPELHPILHWLAENAVSDRDDRVVSAQYWPDLNEKSRSERFKAFLELCLAMLARHYRLDDQHRWAKLSISRTAEEIARTLGILDEKIFA